MLLKDKIKEYIGVECHLSIVTDGYASVTFSKTSKGGCITEVGDDYIVLEKNDHNGRRRYIYHPCQVIIEIKS